MDCFDGAIVGLKMADNMRTELCTDAFTSAIKNYQAYGMIFHSDRGSQYTSKLYREILAKYAAKQSMSATGKCYDNARMESFFATLKKEGIYKFKTEKMRMETVKSIVFRFIEVYYNRKRIYTTNGGYPPLMKRSLFYQTRFPKQYKNQSRSCSTKMSQDPFTLWSGIVRQGQVVFSG
jgi:putative transposase